MGRLAATAVIFDLDGTVWDSYPFYAAAVADGDSAEHERVLARLRAAESAATQLRRARISKSAFRQLCEGGDTVGLYAGVLPAFRKLHRGGVPLGAVTNLPGWMAQPMLAGHGLDDILDSVVTWERTTRHKPYPAPLELCCQELGVDPDARAWYVGDSAGDCQAALAAGMSFAWAAWGYGTQSPPGSHVTLNRFADISAL